MHRVSIHSRKPWFLCLHQVRPIEPSPGKATSVVARNRPPTGGHIFVIRYISYASPALYRIFLFLEIPNKSKPDMMLELISVKIRAHRRVCRTTPRTADLIARKRRLVNHPKPMQFTENLKGAPTQMRLTTRAQS